MSSTEMAVKFEVDLSDDIERIWRSIVVVVRAVGAYLDCDEA